MPELPEVETLRRQLDETLKGGLIFERIELLRADIRDPIPKKKISQLLGEPLLAVERRAKYLLFRFPSGYIISHLGMTGSWRRLADGQSASKAAHDHVILDFSVAGRFVFADPRRFGILDVHLGSDIERHKRFSHLGREPLATDFRAEDFLQLLKGAKAPIKNHLMNQKVLVGVGNIYASEALFRSKIRPTRRALRVTRAEALQLFDEIQKVLNEAIVAGGSTIRDYRSMDDQAGEFQKTHFVYGRQDELCRICHGKIRSQFLAGRNTFWCPKCQQ